MRLAPWPLPQVLAQAWTRRRAHDAPRAVRALWLRACRWATRGAGRGGRGR